jgi:toxin ParE1/3/4
MKILWSDFSVQMLSEIYIYYKEKVHPELAKRILKELLEATRQLRNQPTSGQTEPALIKMGEGHRYIVRGNYKIVYKPIPEGLLITDVFDTRQNPSKLNDPERK